MDPRGVQGSTQVSCEDRPIIRPDTNLWPRTEQEFNALLAKHDKSKAVALLEGRAHVAFADVQRVAGPVLRHRLIRSFEGEADGISTDQVIAAVIEAVPTRPAPVTEAIKR